MYRTMKKNQYIAPEILIDSAFTENMIALSLSSEVNASEDYEMEVKSPGSYNVWDDDWSED